MVGGVECIFVTKCDQHAMLWAVNQLQFCFQNDRAGYFGAHESAPDVKSVFGQEIIKAVAGNAPGDFWISRPNQIGVVVSNFAQLFINLSATPAVPDNCLQLTFTCC